MEQQRITVEGYVSPVQAVEMAMAWIGVSADHDFVDRLISRLAARGAVTFEATAPNAWSSQPITIGIRRMLTRKGYQISAW